MPVDEKFKNELAKFAASLGLEKLRQEAVGESDDEQSEEEDAEEDVEEAEEEEEEEPQPPPLREEASKGKTGKLVSKHSLENPPITPV